MGAQGKKTVYADRKLLQAENHKAVSQKIIDGEACNHITYVVNMHAKYACRKGGVSIG